MTVYAEFETWMQTSCQPRLSAKTAVQYRRRIRQAVEDYRFDPRIADEREVEQFINDVSKSDSSADSWVGAFRRFEQFWQDQGNDVEFCGRLRMRRRPSRLPRPMDVQDLIKMLDSIDTSTLLGVRNRAVCELLYCNLRNSELASSNIGSFRRQEVRVIGKGNKERFVPINNEAWFWITTYALMCYGLQPSRDLEELDQQFETLLDKVDPATPMFLSVTGNRITDDTVRDIVASARTNAGITIRATPHTLRHSFATHLIDNGLTDLFALKEVMGHERLETTAGYVKVSARGRRRINQLHPRQRRTIKED